MRNGFSGYSGRLNPAFGTRVLRQDMMQSHVSMGSFFPSTLACGDLLQADAWRHLAVGPELGKVQELPGGPRDLEPQRLAPGNDLRGNVDHPPSQGIRAGRDRDHLTADVLLERLIEKERNAHEVVEGGIGAVPLKGKPLIGKLFEDAEGQLTAAAMMIAADDPLGREHRVETGFAELLIDPVAHAEVGVEHGAGPGKGEEKLIVLGDRPGEKRSTETLPTAPAIAELHILPHTAVFDFFAANVAAPCFLGHLPNSVDDIRVKLSAADVAHVPAFHGLEELLVHVAAVEVENDGDIFAIATSNPVNHTSHHALGPMAVVAVLVPGAENRIDDKAFPGHLERAKPFVFLVRGHHALVLVGLVVVHAHDIDVEQDDLRLADLEPPEEKLEQDPAANPDQRPREGLKEAFDPMGRNHVAGDGLDGRSIAPILLQGIEVGQVPAGAVQEEAKDLLEKTLDGDPFAVFTKTPKARHQEIGNHLDLVYIAHEKGHASASGNTLVSRFNLGDPLAFAPAATGSAHRIPDFLGDHL